MVRFFRGWPRDRWGRGGLAALFLLLLLPPGNGWGFYSHHLVAGTATATDTTAPTINGNPTIGSDGTTVTVNFSETVVTTGYDNGDFNLDCTTAGTDISLDSIAGSGSQRTFTAASTINSGDTCNLDTGTGYGADEIEDAAGNDLAAVTDQAVTNNSTQGAGPDILDESFDVAGYDNSTEWTESGNGSVDEDATTIPPIGQTGFTTQYLRHSGTWQTSICTWTDGTDHSEVYISLHFYIEDESLSDGEDLNYLVRIRDSASNDLVLLQLSQVATNQLRIGIADGNYGFTDNANINPDTAYELEIYMNNSTTDTITWRLDGVQQGTDSTITYDGDFRSLELGGVSGSYASGDVGFDTIKIDSSDWP